MFKDVPKDHWAYETIARLADMGAISGYPDGTFRPDEPVTRAGVAALIDKALHYEYELVRRLLPSVIKITAKLANGKISLGSGVVLDQEGYICTNCHVVLDGIDPTQEVLVYLDAMPAAGIKAKVLYGDLSKDIAILKIQADKSFLNPVTFPNTSVRLLEKVFCIGNPLGFTDTVSAGVVTCAERTVNGNTWIQTDAAVNPGNSGGGCFNVRGQFVGMPTFIYVWADEEKTVPVSNIGFIVPWQSVLAIYQKAKGGQVAFTGALAREVVFK